MTKTLHTLVKDIQGVLVDPPEITDEQARQLSDGLAKVVQDKFAEVRAVRQGRLRMSNLGSKCLRKLWYSVNVPEAAEKLPASARLKFLYGDVIEALVIWLAKLAGHEVKGEQDTLEINGIVGHRDGVIDGVTCDVKSASTFSYAKFEKGLRPAEDSFGYLDQIGAYSHCEKQAGGSADGAFIVVDKTLGHITVDYHKDIGNKDYGAFVDERKAAVAQKTPPPRQFFAVKDGQSGNEKLGTECSYCDFKRLCWPGVRAYAYAGGPRYLVTVKREPDVPLLPDVPK